MKKITTYTFLLWALILSIGANAQYCGSSQISSCGSAPSYYGIGVLDSIPCLVRGGTMNNITTKIKIYNTFNSNAGRVNVLKLRIDSITNLPCGMCWSTNSPTNEFLADALCCLNIKGATNGLLSLSGTDRYQHIRCDRCDCRRRQHIPLPESTKSRWCMSACRHLRRLTATSIILLI